MAVQSTYLEEMAVSYAGMIANEEPNNLISRDVETAAGIGFGLPVQQGTADGQVILMAAAATDCVGITVRDQSATADLVPQYESALLMRQGVIWVTVTDAGGVAAGDDVWVAVATGAFSNADLGSSGSIQLAGCRWDSSAANGELAKLRVNLDVPAVAGA